MSEETEFEANFPALIKGVKGKDGKWTVTIQRKSDNKTFPVTILKGLSNNDCYVRLGVKVPETAIPLEEGVAGAKQILSNALNSVSGRTMLSATEVQDIFLDTMNKLGWNDAEPDK